MAERTGRAWVELDLQALAHNVNVLRSLLPPGCVLMPAVKANAYGHGAVPVARALNDLGVEAMCVACLSEGIELRQAGVRGEILILGYTRPEEAPLLARWDLTQTVTAPCHAAALNAGGVPLRVHVKVDTGMHRLGAAWEDPEALRPLFSLPNLTVTGVFTHLCAADSGERRDRAFTLEQGERFYRVVERLRAMGCSVPRVHLLASHGLVNYPELGGDMARVGIALYGTWSSRGDWLARPVDLRPVLSLKARIALVRELAAGEGAGYGLRFTASRPTRLAVAAIGYADGMPRSLSIGAGAALVGGQKVPIAGRICMDQTLLDVTEAPGVSPGDTAIFIGRSGQEEVTALDLAENAGTITNEVLSRLGSRLERVAR